MPARLCSACCITFPAGIKECEACGGETKYDGTATPDEDWETRVEMNKPPTLEAQKLRSWRERRLTQMGFAGAFLDVLVETPSVGLHDIEALLSRGCSHDETARILL